LLARRTHDAGDRPVDAILPRRCGIGTVILPESHSGRELYPLSTRESHYYDRFLLIFVNSRPRKNVEPLMSTPTVDRLRDELSKRSAQTASYSTEAVDLLLKAATELHASDLHLQPTVNGLDVRWRLDGVLNPVIVLPSEVSAKVVARLKVMADLLTYRTDIPQEGRIRGEAGAVEMRLSTFPTLHGEKAVVRVFAGSDRYLRLGDLGFPEEVESTLHRLLGATSGAVIFCGPAGSGKSTTIHACLRELVDVSGGRRSLASLEDPIEVAIPGVAQSQVNAGSGFSLEVGLRSLLRQDPEVIAVGEVRDRVTAEVAFQASLTGHLVLTTFHAAGATSAVSRLGDMGIEPYLLRSGLLAIVGQRLVRRLCECARPGEDPRDLLGIQAASFRLPVGCPECWMTGYRGRIPLAEILVTEPTEVGRAILSRLDSSQLEVLAVGSGMIPLREHARRAVEEGRTSPAEVLRTFGVEGRMGNSPVAG
jgi:general secretion pathway protein E